MTDRVGQQFGKYRLTRLLGRGGFAEVYLGERVDIGMFAAIKIGQSQLSNDEESAFRTEAHTLAQLVHPNIVRLLDFDVQRGTPFLVMDYAPHGSLRQHHPVGAVVPLNKVVSYVQPLASALYYAHHRTIIHRDVKPENMLLGQSREVVLSDFGIARVGSNSTTFNISGTLHYMSPEQFIGKIYPASDQYALGAVVYEWLAGSFLFSNQLQMQGLINMILNQQPAPLRQKAPQISSAVEQVVMRTLEKDPDRRFPTIMEFATALERAASTTSFSRNPSTPNPPSGSSGLKQSIPPPPPRGPVSNVPALPLVDTKQLAWPTFSLTLAQKQEIARGQLPLVALRTTATLTNTLPRPLPVGQVVIPPMTHNLNKLLDSGVLVIRQTPPANIPVTPVNGPSKSPAGVPPLIMRTTNIGNSSMPVKPPQKASASPGTMIRQTGTGTGGTSSYTPSQSPTARPAGAGKAVALNWLAWILVLTCGLFAMINLSMLNSHSGISMSYFNGSDIFIYIGSTIAFIMNIVSIRISNASRLRGTRTAAIWSLIFVITIVVVEISQSTYLHQHLYLYNISA